MRQCEYEKSNWEFDIKLCLKLSSLEMLMRIVCVVIFVCLKYATATSTGENYKR